MGQKTQNLTFTLSERKGLEILEKVEKSWKKLKKWPNNHYLATLGIYLQFHDFQGFSKKLLRKYLQPDVLTDGLNMFENLITFRITYQKLS